ncbi:zonula occludens toxin (Zot) family protein [Campylobacter blaseri]|uniref:Zonular occludens toxin n=1 Tax=Campylobacter blaseri TaxID=2042961 RepID=A0A2P8R2K3_9BACT|nr:zonular occludens toxin domain-containing protein [Campylobacter blaseri]PSM52719.1 zonular occludens toxin [Campylobacter blaseri]PSM54367.1 zonular occludens toxin [Campylobacter blaseri]QKF86023.1 zonula occludens toxin (Zot) family protein [Campylobacter blaseri]
MLSLIIGPPGSGKTYKVVNDIYEQYQLHLKDESKYKCIYTNINGFDFDKFNGYVKKFDRFDLLSNAEKEYSLNKQHESGFLGDIGDYDEYAKNQGIYKDYIDSLIVIDEAYNIFNKNFNDNLGRFLSYHRHFNIDIVFMLQSKRQTNREYIIHSELLYVAQPSSKRLFKSVFRYKKYSTYEEKKDNLITTQNLRFKKDIAKLYQSGSDKIYKSYATGKIFFLLFLILFFYLFYNFLKPKQNNTNQQNTEIKAVSSDIKEIDLNVDNKHPIYEDSIDNNKSIIYLYGDNSYFKVTCFPNSCKFSNYTLDLQSETFVELISVSDCQIIVSDKKAVNYIDYYLTCPKEFEEFLIKINNTNNANNTNTIQRVDNEKGNMFNRFNK